jgi:hypothetical protein
MRNIPESAPYAPGNTASRQAAAGIYHQLDGIRADVFDHIAYRLKLGATGSEIATALNILPYTAKPRCTELKDAGYILDSGTVRKNDNGRNETVWVKADSYPRGAYKPPNARETTEEGPSGLAVFDDVFRRNPHLRNTFRQDEINTIRAALEAAEGLS